MAYRILVVDDDRSIIKNDKGPFLEMEEYHVDTALKWRRCTSESRNASGFNYT